VSPAATGLAWTLVVEDHHRTGSGATRQVVPLPGGVAGITAGRAGGMPGRGLLSAYLPA
jgi:hypothetical protein